MQLLITVQFPFGRFHGREFPPSPSRLFQALIAGSHRGVYEKQHPETRNRALSWLENLAPPVIERAAFVESGSGVVNYVPNNDNSFTHIKTAKSLRAFIVADDAAAVRYVWQLADTDENRTNAAVVGKMARLLTHLGHGQDAVFARGEIRSATTAANKSKSPALAEVLHPQERAGADWPAPRAGALTAYRDRYARFLATGNSHARPAPSRQVEYWPADTLNLRVPCAPLEMRQWDDDDTFHGVDARCLRQPVAQVRHALSEFFKSAAGARFEATYGADLITRKIFGHEPQPKADAKNKAVEAPHLAIIPLPNLFPSGYADGWMRRVLLVGFGFTGALEQQLFNDVARQMNGAELKDRARQMPVARLLRPENAQDDKVFKKFLHARPARVWRSVTPIILPGMNRRSRDPRLLVHSALAKIGLGPEVVESVAVSRSPLITNTFHAMSYNVSGYLNETPRYHAEIIFKRPVVGLLAVGRGRHTGFGLMYPVE